MNRLIMIGCSIALWASPVLADVNAPMAAGGGKSERPESCQQIETACREAGFSTGPAAPKGKRLFRDCMRPIMDGKTVDGVALDSTVAEACRARGRKHK